MLRRWGSGLQKDGRDEVAAAGRAILLLIEEIERLHVLLWDRKLYPDEPIEKPVPETESVAEHAGDGEAEEDQPEALHRTLRDRLRRGRRDRFSTA